MNPKTPTRGNVVKTLRAWGTEVIEIEWHLPGGQVVTVTYTAPQITTPLAGQEQTDHG